MDIKNPLTKEQNNESLNEKKRIAENYKIKPKITSSTSPKRSISPTPATQQSSAPVSRSQSPNTAQQRVNERKRKDRLEEETRVEAEKERAEERKKKNEEVKEQKTKRLEKEKKKQTQETINFEKTKRGWYGFVMDVDGVPNSRLQVTEKDGIDKNTGVNPSYYLIGVLLDASKPENRIISAGYINNIDPDPYYDCANQTKLLGSLNSDAVIDAFNGDTVYPVLNAFVAFVSENIFAREKEEDEDATDATLLLWLNLLMNRQVSAGENTVLLKGTTDNKTLTVSMVQTATQKYSPSILYEVQSAKDKELAKYKETDPKLQPFFYVLNALTKQHPFSNCAPIDTLASYPNTTYATSAEKIDKPAEVSIKGELVKVVESLIGVLSNSPVTNTGNKSIKPSDQKYEIEFEIGLNENSINLANIQKDGVLITSEDNNNNIFICIIAIGVNSETIRFVKTIRQGSPVESTKPSSKPAFRGGYESGLLENILYRKNKTLRRLKNHKMNI
jgi:hypothetical protein